ncbi:MAG: hypothetical protein ACE5JR_13955 [Gemmatimonadota bacterium]
MDRAEVLLTTAEIAIAFAGFGGLAGLLGRHRTRDDVRIDVMRLRAILEGSLMVAGAAALPLVLSSYSEGSDSIWRVASGLFLLASLMLVGLWTKRIRAVVAAGVALDRRIVGMFYLIAVVMTGLLGLNLLNVSPGRLFPRYVSALYTQLFGMAILFLRLVASLVATAGHDETS